LWTTLDNSDPVTHTYGGFDSYFVMDARVSYKMDAHWSAAVGVDNLNDRNYFLFHPFPQRTVVGELRYHL
jgi:iron complex outermembrane receptor protein